MKCLYGRAGGRTPRHNEIFSDGYSLPNFVTHGAPLRALRVRESSANNSDNNNGNNDDDHNISLLLLLLLLLFLLLLSLLLLIH